MRRHETKSEKRERQAVSDERAHQLTMAKTQSLDARDYSVVRDRIAQDLYRAAGVGEKNITPTLNREQIAELRMPAQYQRDERIDDHPEQRHDPAADEEPRQLAEHRAAMRREGGEHCAFMPRAAAAMLRLAL